MSTVAQPSTRGHRTLRLPISEADYERFMTRRRLPKRSLDELYEQHPELFPAGWSKAMCCMGYRSLAQTTAALPASSTATRTRRCGRWRRPL